jgi:hypothetical protein
VKTLAVAEWKLEDAVIGSEDEDIARGVEDGGADLAMLEVALHVGAYGFVERVVEIAGDLVPDVAAV